MRIAYLILAYNQPNHLVRLVNALNSGEVYFFIHIDKKSNLNDFTRVINSQNVIFIQDRVKVYWGGFSQVQATLNLLRTAENFTAKFDRYCRLSGADFPIKSKSYIKEFFTKNYQTEFIRIDDKLINNKEGSHYKSIERYHFLDNPFLNPKVAKIQFLRILIKNILKIFPGRKIKDIIPYKGSSWWCLTNDSVKYILNFIRDNPGYIRFHKNVSISEEIFFHSIIKSSPFEENISKDYSNQDKSSGFFDDNEHGAHYIDWKNGDLNSPKILTEFDFEKLVVSETIFARKFDQFISQKLLKMLEDKITMEK